MGNRGGRGAHQQVDISHHRRSRGGRAEIVSENAQEGAAHSKKEFGVDAGKLYVCSIRRGQTTVHESSNHGQLGLAIRLWRIFVRYFSASELPRHTPQNHAYHTWSHQRPRKQWTRRLLAKYAPSHWENMS